MTIFQSEALLLCLLGSLIWAPFVYLCASTLDRNQTIRVSEKIWAGALAAAILPVVLAPVLSSAGISLRPAPVIEKLIAPNEATLNETVAPALPEETPIAEPYSAPSTGTEAITLAPILTPTTTTEVTAAAPKVSRDLLFKSLSLLYIYGAALAFGLWLMRSIGFALSTSRAHDIEDETLYAVVNEWRLQMGVRSPLRIKESARISSVCVYGFFHPVILIPSELRNTASFEDLVIMCAHELAHIKRGDTCLFGIGAAARTLFWFNPFIKRITAQAELSAEQGADALVVQNGVNRRTYAACFVEGLRFAARRPVQSFSALPTFTPLDRKGRRKRLDSILSGPGDTSLSLRNQLMLGSAGVVAASAVFIQAAVAVHPTPIEETIIPDDIPVFVGIDDFLPLAELAPTEPNAPEILSLNIAPEPPAIPITENEPPSIDIRIAENLKDNTNLKMALPVDGKITSRFGTERKNTQTGKVFKHNGIDIAAPKGTPIKTPADGKVIAATDRFQGKKSWGKLIMIDHGNGIKTRYAHLDAYGVMKGDRVFSGDIIGKVGTTGQTTGPHVHFEVIVDGKNVDPLTNLSALNLPQPLTAPKPYKPTTMDRQGLLLQDILKDAVDDALDHAHATMHETHKNHDTLIKTVVATKVKKHTSHGGHTTHKRHRSISPSFHGGHPLTAKQRIEIEKSFKKMRREMAAARHQRANKKAHKTAQAGFITYHGKKNDAPPKHDLKKIEHAAEKIEKDLKEKILKIEASILNSREMKKLKIESDTFQRHNAKEAMRVLKAQDTNQLSKLRDAEKTIEDQRLEIERLRAELAEKN